MIVPIDEEQIEYAEKVAKEIWDKDHALGLKDMACGDTHKIGNIGYLAEVLYADYYGVSRPVCLDGIDAGWDSELNGQRIQIKARSIKKHPYLILFPYHLKKPFEYLALVLIDYDRNIAKIVEVTKQEFLEKCFDKDFGFGMRKVMDCVEYVQ